MKITEKVGLVLVTVLAFFVVVVAVKLLVDSLWLGMGLYVVGIALLIWVSGKVDLRR